MPLKKFVRTLHLWLGLASGLVIFTVAVTGSIYAFEKEFRSILHKDLYEVTPGNQQVPVSNIIDAVKNQNPKQPIKNILFPAEKNKSLQVNLKNKTAVFVNPYNGEIIGSLDMEKEFLAVVLKIHRSLCMGDTGKIITGTSAAIFLVMLISGIILWWPKNKRSLKFKLQVKKDAGKKRLFYDLHSVLGFYASWILIFSVITGLIFAFKPVEGFMYFLAGSKNENDKPKSIMGPGIKKTVPDLIIADAYAKYPTKEFFLVFPDDSTGTYRLTVNFEGEGLLKENDHLFYDQYSGNVIKKKLFDQESLGERLRSTNYNIHTGKVFGIPGQMLVFLAALVAASLPVTGVWMWWSKRKRGGSAQQDLEDFS